MNLNTTNALYPAFDPTWAEQLLQTDFSALYQKGAPLCVIDDSSAHIVFATPAMLKTFATNNLSLLEYYLLNLHSASGRYLHELLVDILPDTPPRRICLRHFLGQKARTTLWFCARITIENKIMFIMSRDLETSLYINDHAKIKTSTSTRFTWKLDENERFYAIDNVLIQHFGAFAPSEGETLPAFEARLGLSSLWYEKVQARQGFSRLEWLWPRKDRKDRACTQLFGTPIVDVDGRFRGFRGFGIVTGDYTSLPDARDRTPSSTPIKASANSADIVVLHPRAPISESENVMLSHQERDAFREIARVLGVTVREDVSLPDPPPERDEVKISAEESISDWIDSFFIPIIILRNSDVLYANKAFLEHTHYVDHDALCVQTLFQDRQLDEIDAKSKPEILFLSSGEGKKISVCAQEQSVLWDGEPARLIALLPQYSPFDEDIVHAHTQEEITQNANVKRANADKTALLAHVAHEVRTPLNAILGFADMMLEERFGPLGPQRYHEYMRYIHTAGRYILSLVNDLLDLTKIELGKREMQFARIDINPIVQECVTLMQPQAAQAHVLMRMSLHEQAHSVMANSRALKQILLNLLANAIQYNVKGGQVIVSTTVDSEGCLWIRVRDTGVGMNESELEIALEPFRRVGSKDVEGTGLGLPLTKALVEACRADFFIKSQKDQGTLAEIAFRQHRDATRLIL